LEEGSLARDPSLFARKVDLAAMFCRQRLSLLVFGKGEFPESFRVLIGKGQLAQRPSNFSK
jgi:hypothetical protein